MLCFRHLRPFLACFALASLAAAQEESKLEQRLGRLVERLEAERIQAHIPGMSIAIVKDDQLILARGFGLADVAARKPANENTIYPIASTTKAFTATLVGMLVDEGKLDWDDPVTRFLPYFDLPVRSEDEDAACSMRDLLSHRHGFARMGALFLSGQATRDEILHTAVGAEPWDDFRKGFHYCNVTYLAAGVAAGVADGSSWELMMQERLFDPLGMHSSSLSVAKAQQDERLALGYKWDPEAERYVHSPMFDMQSIGPAGSVNSNVLDMAQWLRMQLGRGTLDDLELISTESHRETWEPQISVGGGMAYGLGWMLGQHRGRQVVEHGGNINGFSAQVGLMPAENMGYVLLTNRDMAAFQHSSLAVVFDALLSTPKKQVVEAHAELAHEELLGTYIANFASFRDEAFEIQWRAGKLLLHIPSQQTNELRPPDEEGKWRFVVSDQAAVSFQRDAAGKVRGLTVHQRDFHFEVPRKGSVPVPTGDPSELNRYLGIYKRQQGGKRVEILLVQGRLTLEDKGNRLAFEDPDADGEARLCARETWGASFHQDENGWVDSFVFHGASGDRLFKRQSTLEDEPRVGLQEVLALRMTPARKAAQEKLGATKRTGTVWIAQSGIGGRLVSYAGSGGSYANHVDLGKFGRLLELSNGSLAWTKNPMEGLVTLQGAELAQAMLEHPDFLDGDWTLNFDSIRLEGQASVRGRSVHLLRMLKQGLPSRTYAIDAENGDLLRVRSTHLKGLLKIPITTDFYDFQEFDGLRRPMRIEIQNPMSGKLVQRIESIESGLELEPSLFEIKTAEEAAKSSK